MGRAQGRAPPVWWALRPRLAAHAHGRNLREGIGNTAGLKPKVAPAPGDHSTQSAIPASLRAWGAGLRTCCMHRTCTTYASRAHVHAVHTHTARTLRMLTAHAPHMHIDRTHTQAHTRAAAVGVFLRALLEDRAEVVAAALYLQRHAPITPGDEDEVWAVRARYAARHSPKSAATSQQPERVASRRAPNPSACLGPPLGPKWSALAARPPKRVPLCGVRSVA